MNLASSYNKTDRLLTTLGGWLQPILLLLLRGWWGWSFFQTGKGKLTDLSGPASYFASLGIPAPKLNAMLAGSVECVGGLLLLVGLGSRVVTVPLIATMGVAYATAHRDTLRALFAKPDDFTSAPPFLFLLTCLVVFAFGPGKLSLDYLFFKKGAKA
jgi:putative oxidoreductase